jgi:hypothetical protein
MSHYRNGCTCERCKTRGLMGPAILVTLGVILLLDQFNVVGFWSAAPVLLIVIGLVKVLQSNASMEGHVNEYVAYPGYIVTPTAPVAAPPQNPNQGQVSNG